MAFNKINFKDKDLTLFQDNVANALGANTNVTEKSTQNGQIVFTRTFTSPPFVGGNLIKLALTSGQDNLVPHGLGRLPVVWAIARQDTNTTVWEVSTTKLASSQVSSRSASEDFLNLWCGSACNVTLWVN